MGEGAAAGYQAMLRKVQEIDYHTSVEEQADIERAGYDVRFPPQNRFMTQINADIQSFEGQLRRRAVRERLSDDEVERERLRFSVQWYERGMKQLMALYDLWKRQHSPNFVENLYTLSLAIDGVKQSLDNKKAEFCFS